MKTLILFLVAILLITCNSKNDNRVVRKTNSYDSLIDIEALDIDHPLWDSTYIRNYDVTDLDQLLNVASLYQDSVKIVIHSFKYKMDKQRCLDENTKQKINIALDSLVATHERYVDWSQECEVISFRDGKAAGKNSLDYRIFLYRKFLIYLKHLTNTLYYAYLEPGVLPCSEEKEE